MQMPDVLLTERTLTPNPWKAAGMAAICLAFAAIGLLMARDGQAMGWVCLLFFGAGGLVLAASAVPGASHLRLTRDGFRTRTLWRDGVGYRWADIERFRVGVIRHNRMVMFDFSGTYHKQETARKLARAIGGAEGALPDTYGLGAQGLADLMNAFLDADRRREAFRNG